MPIPIEKTGPTANQQISKEVEIKNGRWRRKRSDAGTKRGK